MSEDVCLCGHTEGMHLHDTGSFIWLLRAECTACKCPRYQIPPRTEHTRKVYELRKLGNEANP